MSEIFLKVSQILLELYIFKFSARTKPKTPHTPTPILSPLLLIPIHSLSAFVPPHRRLRHALFEISCIHQMFLQTFLAVLMPGAARSDPFDRVAHQEFVEAGCQDGGGYVYEDGYPGVLCWVGVLISFGCRRYGAAIRAYVFVAESFFSEKYSGHESCA